MQPLDKRKELLAHEFGIMYANFKFKEMLILEYQPKSFQWKNFPEIFEFQVKNELLRFYNYNLMHFDIFSEIAMGSFINEGYRLKELYVLSK